ELDRTTIEAISAAKDKITNLLEEYKFRDALFEVINLARTGNQYMQKKEPWIVAKKLRPEMGDRSEEQMLIDNCLHICLQLTANLAILINPFLPFTA
ncbi:hypothetical protein ACI4A6_27825, partial [Klebsiella pneumoniae]